MSNYSPTSSSYETAPTSPSETPYNAENRNTTTGENDVLDWRSLQQLQLSIALAQVERVANQLQASLNTTTRELDRQMTELHHDMEVILSLRKEDLKRDQRRRNQTLLFCVLVVLTAILLSWVLGHRGKELLELLDIE
ncbi:hypothetical protein FMUND_1413 [Fusarium mundagurra]|uniref:Uncharacterized protein n=1 Tax=Fusarium mundagurra TaxID=1567541 RepID=A0A8H5Z6P4_9HYPO|nr:hypothetical protein FMUND_1413 [Fusarium mundagurra]